MLEVPVYVITGFLESGKTSFIRDVLQSPDFADGEKTLVLLCEEGEEEYDERELDRHNIYIERVEKEEDLAPSNLEALHRKYKPKRVFIESQVPLNSTNTRFGLYLRCSTSSFEGARSSSFSTRSI